ncbi:MAG: prephenate dehydrogenase/arogenate dehydrogenase family protein [Gemmataceae bacterium]
MILGIVGVGLLGGSLALAARRRNVSSRILGTDRLPGVLARAVERGLIDQAMPTPESVAAQADLTLFCTPVDQIATQALAAAPHAKGILTDVGSTKASIAAALAQVPHFVPGHPLAGSEKAGPEYARDDLFAGRLVLLTPTAQTQTQAIDRVRAFWHALEARVETLDAVEHDRALALTSHLPHLVASALARILPRQWRGLTASGFRDSTRLASGSVELWRAIFLHNREALREALSRLREELDHYDAALAAGDSQTLTTLLEQAKQSRDGLR